MKCEVTCWVHPKLATDICHPLHIIRQFLQMPVEDMYVAHRRSENGPDAWNVFCVRIGIVSEN